MQHGQTALMIAVCNNNNEIVRLLMECGASLSLRDNVCDNICKKTSYLNLIIINKYNELIIFTERYDGTRIRYYE